MRLRAVPRFPPPIDDAIDAAIEGGGASAYLGSMNAPVRLSPAAAKRVALIAQRQGDPSLKLRLSVDGGGCAGFQYKFGLESEVAADDVVTETDGVQLVIDATSLPFIDGSEVDYVESLGGAAFQVRNPNATSGCGCGTSFSV